MLVAPFDVAEGSGPGGRVREVYRLPGQLEAGPRGAAPPGPARCLRYADVGDPSAELHQALGILLGVRPAEERCYTGRRIAAGGQVITS